MWFTVTRFLRQCRVRCQRFQPDTQAVYLKACRQGNVNIVRDCLEEDSSLSREDGLTIACLYGHVQLAEALVDSGAQNINDGLVLGCSRDKNNLVEALLKKGADPVHGLRVSRTINMLNLLSKYAKK